MDALDVFFSYSHRDQALRDQLDTHLELLKRRDLIRTWYDGGITAGQEFEPEIFAQLDAAHVILLLISPDFIKSEFCWRREMQRAMERHDAGEARVIPILLRPLDDWQSAPFGKLKTLPKDGLAVTKWPDQDSAFEDVTAGIRRAVEDLAHHRASAPPSKKALQVVLLIGHSVAAPLPAAVEMARVAVADFQGAGLDVELRVDQATTTSFEREAAEGCDLFIYYGHGTEDSRLSFADGPKSLSDLSHPGLDGFWRGLGAALIFACYGDRFARPLPCPWIAFSEPILTQAPKGFLHALIPLLAECDLATAVGRARALCAREMRSSFPDAMRFSDAPLPPLRRSPGTARLRRLSPALAQSHRLDFYSDEDLYPADDPFVGRVHDLETLLRLPSPYDDRPLQRVVWIPGDAGMGKSALLRQLAIFVRDLAFREAAELVHLLHLHCYKYTRPEEVVEALCSRAADLYGFDPQPASLEALFGALEHRFGTRGTHVWVLDDLTYLSLQPDSTDEAGRLVFRLRDLANSHGLRWQLVVSSRRPGPRLFEHLEVGPLDAQEAQALAVRVWSSRRGPETVSADEVVFGAMQLFRVVQSTGQYKRALLLALDRGMTYRAYAAGLGEGGGLEATEQLEAARRMLAFEVRQLAALEARHGFSYSAFLGLYYPLIARAAFFTRAELEEWFEDRLVAESAQTSRAQVYDNGLRYLIRLSFVSLENRSGEQIFSMPPNQRWSMRALSNGLAQLPAAVPRRGAHQRLSLALEGLNRGDWGALGDLLTMAGDYQKDLDDPSCAAAVFCSMLGQAELAAADPEGQLSILGKIVELYDSSRTSYPTNETEASEQVAKALFNMGAILGALSRSQEAIDVYDQVVTRYGDRQEPALAEKVAMALFNKGVGLGALGRSQEEIDAYDQVVARYGDRQEPALAEQVAKAFVNKGVRLGALSSSQEAIDVYDQVVARYGDRQEPALAAQVAKALFNKGVLLEALSSSQEAIDVYDQVVARYEDRQEPALAEQVAKALGNKGWCQYELGHYDLSVASSRAALSREPSATGVRCNMALALLHLGEIAGAREAYAQALEEIATPEDLDRLALHDLDAALEKRPDLPGAREIREMLNSHRQSSPSGTVEAAV